MPAADPGPVPGNDGVSSAAVSDAVLHRLLEVVRRELGADDARIEVGGRPPSDPSSLCCELASGWRLVAVFDRPPPEPEAALALLAALAASFSDLGSRDLPERLPGIARANAQRRLDDELHLLAARVGAVRALVIDDRSPILWGSSEPRGAREDVETALATAAAIEQAARAGLELERWVDASPEELAAELAARRLDRGEAARLELAVRTIRDASRRRGQTAWGHHLLAMRAVGAVRRAIEADPSSRTAHLRLVERGDDFGYLARGFASIYVLVLVFDARFSELHAEAGLLQELPLVERLVVALPSSDPPPAGGQVVRLRR